MARREIRKPQDAVGTIKRLLGFMKGYEKHLVIVFLFVLFASGSQIAGTFMISRVINEGIVPLIGATLTSEALRPFVMLLAMMAGLNLAGLLFQFGYSRIMVVVCNRTLNKIRNTLFGKMQKLPISYFDSHTHGELMAVYTSDVGAVADAISNGITSLMSSVVNIVGVFAMMLFISPLMTITVVVFMGVIFFLTKYIGSKSVVNYKEQQAAVAKMNGYMEEMMGGQKVVKVFTHEEKVNKEFGVINERARKASTRANIYAGIMHPVSNNLSHINYAACSIIGAWLCIIGVLDIGRLASFLQYTKNFSNPVSQIMQRFNSLMSAVAGAERIFRVIDTEPEVNDGKYTLVSATFDDDSNFVETEERTGLWAWKKVNEDGSVQLVRLRGDVRFEDVIFSYDGEKTVLNNVSFYAKPGQKIAFVGATGAGKTTITNLINRFYDIQQGKITYDGIDVKDIEKNSLRRSLAMVLQDTHLFTGTVMENIRYGKLDATDDQVVAAAKLANADEFITMLPEGYNTVLTGDGANLSQGQRQLLSIARAAVADAPVLILDEATSSIDTRTEKLIEEGMDNLMAGRTVFVIAHRLSTVRNANAIMVLDHGVIIERGDHDDLIKQKGKYYSLYTGQFELD